MRFLLYFWILCLSVLIQMGCSGTNLKSDKSRQSGDLQKSSSEESSEESRSSRAR